jgi:hypothetical protein
LDHEKVPEVYWFVRQLSDKNRVLNEAGGYYLLMNAGVLFITCIVTLSYLSISIEVVRIANNIEKSTIANNVLKAKDLPIEKYEAAAAIADNELAETLREFVWCYTLAKIILIFYVFNINLLEIVSLGRSSKCRCCDYCAVIRR